MATITISTRKLQHNVHVAKTVCDARDLDLVIVSKCCSNNKLVLDTLSQINGMHLADANLANLDSICSGTKKSLLLTSQSDLRSAERCNYFYISELVTLRQFDRSGQADGSSVLIPLEMGDGREGVVPGDLAEFLQMASALKRTHIAGFSTNFGCAVLEDESPSTSWLIEYDDVIRNIRRKTGFVPDVIAAGGSSLWSLIDAGHIPDSVNQIRLGEAIFLGRDPGTNQAIDAMHQNAFQLETEIVELKWRSIRDMQRGRSWRRHAIIDIGYGATDPFGLESVIDGVRIVHVCQNFTVVDVTDMDDELSVGGRLIFRFSYRSLARAMNSGEIMVESDNRDDIQVAA